MRAYLMVSRTLFAIIAWTRAQRRDSTAGSSMTTSPARRRHRRLPWGGRHEPSADRLSCRVPLFKLRRLPRPNGIERHAAALRRSRLRYWIASLT
jgi:hypothetical protein